MVVSSKRRTVNGEYTVMSTIESGGGGRYVQFTCMFLLGGSFNGMLVTKDLIKESETDRREGRADKRAEE